MDDAGTSKASGDAGAVPDRVVEEHGNDVVIVEARATLFGFDDVPVRAWILPRSKAWRVGGALRIFAVFAVLAPLVAVFPPHAVWFIGALVVGAVLARRRYVERYTLVAVEGTCPRCGSPLAAKKGRLREPHPLPCEGCNHEPNLKLPPDALSAAS